MNEVKRFTGCLRNDEAFIKNKSYLTDISFPLPLYLLDIVSDGDRSDFACLALLMAA